MDDANLEFLIDFFKNFSTLQHVPDIASAFDSRNVFFRDTILDDKIDLFKRAIVGHRVIKLPGE